MKEDIKVALSLAAVAAVAVGSYFLFKPKEAAAAGNPPPGDVNGDGIVDLSDLLLAQQISEELNNPLTGEPYPADWKTRADVNGDGFVTPADVSLIESIIEGIA